MREIRSLRLVALLWLMPSLVFGQSAEFNLSQFAHSLPMAFALEPGSIVLTNQGSGYAAGDIVTATCAGRNFTTNPQIVISAVSAGAITGSTVTVLGSSNFGSGPSCTLTQQSTTGVGVGAQWTGTFGPIASAINLASLTTGDCCTNPTNGNTYFGAETPAPGIYGAENTFLGDRAGGATIGLSTANTAVGHNAMGIYGTTAPTGALFNTFVGDDAGRNITGTATQSNTCVGQSSCRNMGANGNTAIGQGTLQGSLSASTATTGNNNVAVGFSAMASQSMTTATLNVAVGNNALTAVTTGSSNVAIGNNALLAVTTTSGNTAVGSGAGKAMTNNDGVFIGQNAGLKVTGNFNTVIGQNAASTTLTTGTSNVVIGDSANCDTAAAGTSDTVHICTSQGDLLTITGGATPTSAVAIHSGPLEMGATTFTVTGCGSAGSVTGVGNAGSFTVGTGAGTCTFVVTINGATGMTAQHGWVLNMDDTTAILHCVNVAAVSQTTASAICNSTVTTGDLIKFSVAPY